MVVDGLRTREGRLPGNSTISLRAPVYLGSAPSGKPKVNRDAGAIDDNKSPSKFYEIFKSIKILYFKNRICVLMLFNML